MPTADLIQLYRVASAYYVQGKTQQEIGERENISRSQISRMLDKAREVGIVKIEVSLPEVAGEDAMAAFLKEQLGLRDIVLAGADDNAGEDAVTDAIAAAAAAYLPRAVKNSRIAGLGWGHTMYRLPAFMRQRGSKTDILFVPLIGAAGIDEPCMQINSIVDRVAERMQARAVYTNLPAFREKNVPLTPFENRRMEQLHEYWDQLDCAVFGLGSKKSGLSFFDGEVSGDSRRRIEEADVRGDILSQYFFRDGQLLQTDGSYHTNAFPAGRLKSLPQSICLAGGSHKTEGILAAARAGYFNVLITDTRTAKEMYNRLRSEMTV